jgi:hypothetical protein
MDKRTIETRPAAALFGGYLATLTISLLHRYAGYDPTLDEGMAIVGLCGFAASWLIPPLWWRRSEAEGVATKEDV